MAVMLIGLTFPRRAGLQAVGIYVMLGIAGMPVLAGLFAWMRAGYLIGFILAVWLMGLMRERMGSSSMGMFCLTMLGTACVFGCGVPWLAATIGIERAIALGLMPFIIPGIIKGILLVGVLKFLKT
jgi:biotin transport system substrate-specific component